MKRSDFFETPMYCTHASYRGIDKPYQHQKPRKKPSKPKNPTHPSLGTAITLARVERGIKRDKLAEKAGLSTEIIQKLEYGSSSNPRLLTLRKIAKALEMPLTDLLPQDDWPRTSVEEFLEHTTLDRLNRR